MANQHSGGARRLHLQGWTVGQVRNQYEAGSKKSLIHVGILIRLLLNPEDGGDIFLRNVG
jgi:hypothetical protein